MGVPQLTDPAVPNRPLSARLAWLGALSLASGFPYGFVNEAVPIWLRSSGSSLVDVGLVSAVSFPWTFKFLWAPLVDRFGTRRAWIAGCLVTLALATLALRLVGASHQGSLLWVLLILIVALSATQDIAIDAYTVESTTREELGVANSVRIAAYRVAMFIAGGALIWLAGRTSWDLSFGVGAGALALLGLAALRIPSAPRGATREQPLWEPVAALLRRKDVWAVVAFALLFKLDIAAMEPMTRPFWIDRGFTLEEIGAGLTTGRILATVGGAMLGGLITTRWGIFRALWTLGIVQAASSLGYWWAASAAVSKPLIFGVAMFENFAAGLGTAAFVAFLMSVCERRYAATQYALFSALLALTRSVAGGVSGGIAEDVGYARYFMLTFLVGLPAFGLLPWVRKAGPVTVGT